MSRRKSLLAVVFLAGAVGFSIGWGGQRAEAIPNPCPQIPCIVVHAWWSGPGQQSTAAWIMGTNKGGGPNAVGATPGNTARQNLYSPYPGNTTFVPNIGQYEQYVYQSNTALCGKVGGKWQLPQEVTPSGVFAYVGVVARDGCTGPIVTGP
ncbi:MAG: hypothetical protein K2X87_30160 [Gemmataceae bacterium]|nr:hypothetical protein [Gemmataceae bacterium]